MKLLLLWLIPVLVIVIGVHVVLDKYSRRCPRCRIRWAIQSTGLLPREDMDSDSFYEKYECKHCDHEIWVKHEDQ